MAHRHLSCTALALSVLVSIGTVCCLAMAVRSTHLANGEAQEVEGMELTAFEAMVAADREGANLTLPAKQFNDALQLTSDADHLTQAGNYAEAALKLEEARQILEAVAQTADLQGRSATLENQRRATITYTSAILFVAMATVFFSIALGQYRRFELERILDMEIRLKENENA